MRHNGAAITAKETVVKKNIHPVYVDALVRCVCRNQIATRSTRPDVRVEVCSRCHPFYSGVQQPAAAEGRIERFRRRYRVEAPTVAV